MIIIYWLLTIISILYILFKNRRFDLFTIAVVFYIYYTLPALTGVVEVGDGMYYSEVHFNTYVIISIIMITLITTMFLYDRKQYKIQQKEYLPGIKYIHYSLTFLAFFLLFANIGLIGIEPFFNPDKSVLSQHFRSFYDIAIWIALTAIILGLQNKSFKIVILNFFIVTFTLIVGSRAYFTLAIISIGLLLFREKRLKLIKYKRILFFTGALALFLTFYKEIYKTVKTFDVSQIITSLTNFETFKNASFFIESNSIFASLNIAVEQKFRQEPGVISDILVNSVPLLKDILNFFSYEQTFTSPRFAPIVSREFFPNIHWGMGSNIWAEMYSIGGILTILMFLGLWMLIMWYGNKLLVSQSFISPFLLPGIVYSTFYVHRLDLTLAIGAFKIGIGLFIMFLIIYKIAIKPYLSSSYSIQKHNFKKDINYN